MGRIPQEIIDQVLDRLDIVEVVSGYIPLKRAGRSFKACCPFHNEKTPSFVVSPDKQIYHCFGCHVGGNAINFVMKYESMEFPEALKNLAHKVGVELPKYEPQDKEAASLAARLYEVNKTGALFYQNYLRGQGGKKALEYLKRRGIDASSLAEFKIGYAPDEWEAFRKYSTSKRISPELLKQAGLTIPSEKGKGDYDRFRNRIIFTIFNERDSIVGFGGRVMDDSLPKYINSPESVIYSKSNVLYGLNFARKGIRDNNCAILVEGYLDVIIPYQYGIKNVVATSGTALTPRQVGLLKKYTDTAVMVFDADQAGEAASLRGLDILIESGMNVRIATLPLGEDPDSFVRKYGKEKFEEAIAQAKELFDYKLDLLVERLGERDIAAIADEMLPTIAKVENAVVQSDCLRRLAERLGVHEASLRYEMGKVKADYSYHYEKEGETDKASCDYRGSETHLLGLAIMDKRAFNRINKDLGIDKFCDASIKKVMAILNDFFGAEDEINPGKLLSRLDGDERSRRIVLEAVAKADITQDPHKALEDCIYCVKKENKEDRLKDLTIRLKKAQESNDDSEMKELLTKINNIHKEKVA